MTKPKPRRVVCIVGKPMLETKRNLKDRLGLQHRQALLPHWNFGWPMARPWSRLVGWGWATSSRAMVAPKR